MTKETVPCAPGDFSQMRESPLFSRFDEGAVGRLISAAAIQHHEAGELLFRRGEAADRFFVVIEGHVILYLDTGDDRSSVADIVGPGSAIGEAVVFGEGAYPITAETLDRTRVAAIPGDMFQQMLENRFDLVLALLGEMSLKLRILVRRITDLKMRTTAQRFAAYLLTLTDAEDGEVDVRLPFEKRIVADTLGMKPETLSRAIAKVQNVGVRYHRAADVFRVRDVRALRTFCESTEAEA